MQHHDVKSPRACEGFLPAMLACCVQHGFRLHCCPRQVLLLSEGSFGYHDHSTGCKGAICMELSVWGYTLSAVAICRPRAEYATGQFLMASQHQCSHRHCGDEALAAPGKHLRGGCIHPSSAAEATRLRLAAASLQSHTPAPGAEACLPGAVFKLNAETAQSSKPSLCCGAMTGSIQPSSVAKPCFAILAATLLQGHAVIYSKGARLDPHMLLSMAFLDTRSRRQFYELNACRAV